jgi:glucose-1-phosphatase
MNIQRPAFVYFDLGNVLLYFDHGIAMRNMARIAGVTASQMRQLIFDTDLQIQYETGHITGQQFIARIAQHIDKPLDTAAMLQAAADMFVPNLLIVPVLEAVRDKGLPLGLLSNTCEAHWNWICEQRYPQVFGWFSPVVLSFEAKSMKPDEGIYREAQRLANCEPHEIFFTDDRDDNVEGARRAGWQSVPFTSADRLMEIVNRW